MTMPFLSSGRRRLCGGLCESAVSLQMVKVFDKSDVDVQGGSRVVDMTNFQGL